MSTRVTCQHANSIQNGPIGDLKVVHFYHRVERDNVQGLTYGASHVCSKKANPTASVARMAVGRCGRAGRALRGHSRSRESGTRDATMTCATGRVRGLGGAEGRKMLRNAGARLPANRTSGPCVSHCGQQASLPYLVSACVSVRAAGHPVRRSKQRPAKYVNEAPAD